ncbi:MAG: PEP-CTERM sorting domain-containing protein [Phycisphaerales bacterium JB038]
MLPRRNTLLCCAIAFAGAATAAHGAFVYDTTLGTYLDYAGDLSSGVLGFDDIDGRSFRVQVLDSDAQLGNFGVGGASLDMDMEFVSFHDEGDPGFGAGDYALFQSMTGPSYDFVITDEFGETMSGMIDLFQLTDRSNSPVGPGIEGQALITEVLFSGPTFQGVTVPDNLTEGTFIMYIETTNDWSTLGDMLSIGGGGQIYTLEIRLVPAPATLALFGLSGLALRRRR